MNEIQIFKNDSFGAVRTVEVEGTPKYERAKIKSQQRRREVKR